ncbi:hypothetical protein BBBOND_0403260 [Babesia bigemina]|uniref:Uncharacterized protein n=1 Tax=Babesia bigemina TaxID=5866 RepID=A0A061DBD5_BABBI|nr:hypothetical protein BBBOND_0403260 [Babesia bigemina]CDR97838.1 hypothetical protein BBBOND_0403260 [Babesia bigemina]|eukprot:XP_012770024.1 hypothetical protein BBBOND_0403260 [Babesia bigemina]
MAAVHLLLCVLLIHSKCESGVGQFNAQCAGSTLVIFGCLQSLSVALGGPVRVMHALLHRNTSLFRQGTAAAGIATLVMPLRGERGSGLWFFVCLGAPACREHSRTLYLATVTATCIDSCLACGMFWALARGRDFAAVPSPLKKESAANGQNTTHKGSAATTQ